MSQQSLSRFVDVLSEFGPLSRTELAERLNLSKAAVTSLSRLALDGGLVREEASEQNPARLGRPAILLDLNPHYGYFVGACVDDDPIRMVLTDLRGNTLARHHAPLPLDGVDSVVQAVDQGIDALLAATDLPRMRVLGLGLAISGVVDHSLGICRHSAILDWHDVPLAPIIEQATGIPTFLENDANAVATGEKLFGSARQLQDFTVVTLGRGIGGAHFIAGQLYRGHSGGAGEIAHCTIDPAGLRCKCGKTGCLDTIAGKDAILGAAHKRGLTAATLPELEELAANGNSAALEILRSAGSALGLAIAHVINLNDPGVVILTGVDAALGAQLMTAARQATENFILPRLLASTTIQFRHVSGDIWARGAASIAAHSFLTGRLDLADQAASR